MYPSTYSSSRVKVSLWVDLGLWLILFTLAGIVFNGCQGSASIEELKLSPAGIPVGASLELLE